MKVNNQVKVLELFAGSRSIGKEAENLGMQVFSIDKFVTENMNSTLGIEELTKEYILENFGVPDIIWASPVCSAWSKAGWFNHWDSQIYKLTNQFIAKTPFANESIEMIRKTIEIFSWFPGSLFYMENPQGMLCFHPVIKYFEIYGLSVRRNLVTYCQYGDVVQKPTNIWTNNKLWKPRPVCKRKSKCHIRSPRSTHSGLEKVKSCSFERSKIPAELCKEILLDSNHKAEVCSSKQTELIFN